MAIDISLLADKLDYYDKSAQSQFREAPWDAKRLVLKLQLAKQVLQNSRHGIDSSVIVYDLTDKKRIYSHNTEYVHWAASLSKLFIASLLLDDVKSGKTSLDTVVSWEVSDRRAGAGVYDADTSPTSATMREVLFDMLNKSGNTAVRIIINKTMGGAAAVNSRYEKMPELKVTRLEPIDENRFLLGYTTPAEVDFILTKIYRQTDVNAMFVKHALATNIFNDYGPRSQVKDPTNVTVIDKQGQLNDPEGNNRHDVGIIENAKNGHKLRYVLMTTNYEQTAGEATDYATTSLQEFGKDMLRYEGDRESQSPTITPKTLRGSEVMNGRPIY